MVGRTSCTFEAGLCGWVISGNWKRGSATPSSGTGAAKANDGSYFVFLESSSPSTGGLTGYLTHSVPEGSGSLSWYYHMYGATMGTLRLEAYYEGAGWRTLWHKTDQQQTTQAAPFAAAAVPPTPPRARCAHCASRLAQVHSVDTVAQAGNNRKQSQPRGSRRLLLLPMIVWDVRKLHEDRVR